MQKYKAAIIGAGRIGYLLQFDKKREQPASHSSAFKKNRRIHLAAACDINTEVLEQWYKSYPNTTIYEKHDNLLKKEEPEIVIISVNEDAHFQITSDVIKSKPKLIVLEKPVGPNPEICGEIKKLAKRNKIPIVVNHERRYSKDYQKVKELVHRDEIGKIQLVNAYFWSGLRVWHKRYKDDGACSLIHDGTHLVDIIHYLFGNILKKPVIDKVEYGKKKVVERLNLHYLVNKDFLLNMEFNSNKKYFGFELDIIGDQGRIIIGNGYLSLYKRAKSPYYTDFYSLKKNYLFFRPFKTGYFSNMVKNCVDFLDGKEEIISTLDDGINAINVLYDIINCL